MSLKHKLNDKKGFTVIEAIIAGLMVGTLAVGGTAAYFGISALSKYVNEPEVQIADVVGNEKADTFFDFEGKRFFSEIDGKLVSEYLK